jgi:hypothetical protein
LYHYSLESVINGAAFALVLAFQAVIPAVGLYTFNSVDPQLESARFQPFEPIK